MNMVNRMKVDNKTDRMKDALKLVAQGVPIREAARRAGVWHTGLHRHLRFAEGFTPHGWRRGCELIISMPMPGLYGYVRAAHGTNEVFFSDNEITKFNAWLFWWRGGK